MLTFVAITEKKYKVNLPINSYLPKFNFISFSREIKVIRIFFSVFFDFYGHQKSISFLLIFFYPQFYFVEIR